MQEQKLATLTEAVSEGQLEHQLALRETTRLIQEATEQLPAQAKLIFKLTREGGLPAAEVAAQLNISVQYVRNSLNHSSKSIKTYRQNMVLYCRWIFGLPSVALVKNLSLQ